MKSLILFLAVVVGLNAGATKVTPTKQIKCTVSEDDAEGSTRAVAIVTIALDAKGIATNMRIQRVLKADAKSEFLPDALDLSFDNRHALVSHIVRPNKVVDQDADGLIFDWGIARVEEVKAEAANGDSLDIAINDHTYSGAPGATVIYKKDGKTYNSADAGATTYCEGELKFPLKDQVKK